MTPPVRNMSCFVDGIPEVDDALQVSRKVAFQSFIDVETNLRSEFNSPVVTVPISQ
jgi:hypothetical protein